MEQQQQQQQQQQQKQSHQKWEGKLRAHVAGSPAERVWPLFQDFCNLQKWVPNVDTCYEVEGPSGQPGCVRYCAGTLKSLDGEIVGWATEKLTAIDPIRRTLSYEIVDNNVGFGEYAATVEVAPDSGGIGCTIELSFKADPVEGQTAQEFTSYMQSSVEAMAERMGKALETVE